MEAMQSEQDKFNSPCPQPYKTKCSTNRGKRSPQYGKRSPKKRKRSPQRKKRTTKNIVSPYNPSQHNMHVIHTEQEKELTEQDKTLMELFNSDSPQPRRKQCVLATVHSVPGIVSFCDQPKEEQERMRALFRGESIRTKKTQKMPLIVLLMQNYNESNLKCSHNFMIRDLVQLNNS